ncbi:hypothetical protein D3C85_767210 [compost metagenome]
MLGQVLGRSDPNQIHGLGVFTSTHGQGEVGRLPCRSRNLGGEHGARGGRQTWNDTIELACQGLGAVARCNVDFLGDTTAHHRDCFRIKGGGGICHHATSDCRQVCCSRNATGGGCVAVTAGLVGADGAGRGIFQGNVDGFVGVGTHLETGGTEGAVHQLAATEGGGFGDTGQFVLQCRHFFLQRGAVGIAVGAVGGLDGQVAHTLQQVGGLLQGTFSGLRQGDAVVGVAHGNIEAADLVGQAVGNLQASGIILGAVDARTGRQTLQRGVQRVGRAGQVALGVERRDVGIDCQGHDGVLQGLACLPERATLGRLCPGTHKVRIRDLYRRLPGEL